MDEWKTWYILIILILYYDERKRARNQFGRRHSTASGSGQNGARQRVYNNNIIQYIRRIRRLFSLSPSHALRRRRRSRRESVIRNHKNPIHNAAPPPFWFLLHYVQFFCTCVHRVSV